MTAIHQAAYISIMPRPLQCAFHWYFALKVSSPSREIIGVLILSQVFLLIMPIGVFLQQFQVYVDLIPSLDESPGTVVR